MRSLVLQRQIRSQQSQGLPGQAWYGYRQKGRENIRRIEKNLHPNPRWQGQLDFAAPLSRLAGMCADPDSEEECA